MTQPIILKEDYMSKPFRCKIGFHKFRYYEAVDYEGTYECILCGQEWAVEL